VLGRIGRNFAAGMSGGLACVYDEERGLAGRCQAVVRELDDDDRHMLCALLAAHQAATGSRLAARILRDGDWSRFWKAIPSTGEKASPTAVVGEVELVRSA
jgi:glutamate synthase (NADPH/NADH) large chain